MQLFHFDLSFRNPLEIREPDDIRTSYYLHTERLWGLTLRGQGNGFTLLKGIPLRRYDGTELQVNPAHLCWWGLINLNDYLESRTPESLARVRLVLEWLTAHCREKENWAGWPYPFPWPQGREILAPGWFSALAQGLAASFLFRCGHVFHHSAYHELARAALRLMDRELRLGGLKTTLHGGVYYEEYPTAMPTYVLDGALFAVLAWHDYFLDTGDRNPFDAAVETIAVNLDFWNWHDLWSLYGNFGYLCSSQYHWLNVALLKVLFRLTQDQRLASMLAKWTSHSASLPKRCAIAAAYYLTQSAYTIGHPDELQRFVRRRFSKAV